MAPPYGYGQSYGFGYPPARSGPSRSVVALTIVAGLLCLSCYFSVVGLPSFILAIVAMVRADTDPESSARLAKIGWITLGVMVALIILGAVLLGLAIGFGHLGTGDSSDLPDGSI